MRGVGAGRDLGTGHSQSGLGVRGGELGAETSVKDKGSPADARESRVQVGGVAKGEGLLGGFEGQQGHQGDGGIFGKRGLEVAGEWCVSVGPWGALSQSPQDSSGLRLSAPRNEQNLLSVSSSAASPRRACHGSVSRTRCWQDLHVEGKCCVNTRRRNHRDKPPDLGSG